MTATNPNRLIASLMRDQVNLDLKTVDICFLAGLYLRTDKAGLASFEEELLVGQFEQVCDIVEPGAENPRKRATHAIQRLREQHMLARVDARLVTWLRKSSADSVDPMPSKRKYRRKSQSFYHQIGSGRLIDAKPCLTQQPRRCASLTKSCCGTRIICRFALDYVVTINMQYINNVSQQGWCMDSARHNTVTVFQIMYRELLEPHLPGRKGSWGGKARDNRQLIH
jgi:hypothetical protein